MNVISIIYLSILSYQDIRHQKLSMWLLSGAVVPGLVYGAVHHGWSSFCDFLPGMGMCILALLFPNAIGIGDGILVIAYGFFFGWLQACLCLLVALILTAVTGVILCIKKRERGLCLPFVPFVTLAHIGMCL